MVKRKSSMRTRKHAKRRVDRKTNRRKTRTRKRMRGGAHVGVKRLEGSGWNQHWTLSTRPAVINLDGGNLKLTYKSSGGNNSVDNQTVREIQRENDSYILKINPEVLDNKSNTFKIKLDDIRGGNRDAIIRKISEMADEFDRELNEELERELQQLMAAESEPEAQPAPAAAAAPAPAPAAPAPAAAPAEPAAPAAPGPARAVAAGPLASKMKTILSGDLDDKKLNESEIDLRVMKKRVKLEIRKARQAGDQDKVNNLLRKESNIDALISKLQLIRGQKAFKTGKAAVGEMLKVPIEGALELANQIDEFDVALSPMHQALKAAQPVVDQEETETEQLLAQVTDEVTLEAAHRQQDEAETAELLARHAANKEWIKKKEC